MGSVAANYGPRVGAASLALILLMVSGACASSRPLAETLVVSPSTPPEIAAVLTRMPARDQPQEDDLSARLLDLGAPALGTLCGMLGEWGTQDDRAARYALGSLSRYVARPGAESERAAYAAVLLAALQLQQGEQASAFLISQLQLVGNDEAVEPLGALLLDEHLGAPASRALQAIGTPAAQQQLIAVLASARPERRVDVINALGRLRARDAVHDIALHLDSDDRDTRMAADFALANIGSPEAAGALLEALATRSGADRTRAADHLSLLVNRLLQADEGAAAARIARRMVRVGDRSQEGHLQILALQALHQALGPEALSELASASTNSDPAVRQVAARLSAQIRLAEAQRQEQADGFVSLFNGVDLSGWVGETRSYVVQDRSLIFDPRRGHGGNLFTESEFSDFVLRFEFKLTPGANNGLGIRAPLEGDAAYAGLELQILDNAAPRHADLRPYQIHGAIYGAAPAERGHLRPAGEWNAQEVIAQGTRITVILNGATILDVDLDELAATGTPDGRDHPGLKRRSGHIGLLGHGDRVEFRNLRVKEGETVPSTPTLSASSSPARPAESFDCWPRPADGPGGRARNRNQPGATY